jgi:hypothetical protein
MNLEIMGPLILVLRKSLDRLKDGIKASIRMITPPKSKKSATI